VTTANKKSRTVLLVDDNPEILEVTSRYLRARGLDLVTADPALGVSALARRHQPAIIVLDVMMPALDGDALASLLRAQPAVRDTPIVFYSAMEEEELQRIVGTFPGTAYVAKGDGPSALYSAILARL